MLFEIQRKKLITILGNCLKAIPTNTPLVALKNFKIVVKQDRVIFFATSDGNSKITIVKTVHADETLKISSTGMFLVEAKFLDNAIKKMTGDTVKFEMNADNLLKVKSDKAKFQINTLAIKNYPKVAIVERKVENKISIAANILKDGFESTVFAVYNSLEQTIGREILRCVYLEINEDNISFTGTDSYRVSQKTFKTEHNDKQVKLLVHSTTVNSLVSIMLVSALKEDKNAKIDIYYDNKRVAFCYKDLFIQSAFDEGTYPMISTIIDKVKHNPMFLKTNRKNMIDIINRSALFSEDHIQLCKLVLEDNAFKITSGSQEIGDFEEDLDCTFDFSDTQQFLAVLNASYFLQALKAMNAEDVTIYFAPLSDQGYCTNPLYFSEETDNSEICEILLPIRTYL